jgi:imidazole glycerol phosphate synthase subunit HisF
MVRYDAPLNFVWGDGSPGKDVNADNFSVRWTGKVQTLDAPDGTGTYTFQTVSDEGVRVWVDVPDTDGVRGGFDCELTRTVSRATHIPVIASGGAGKPEDFERVFTAGQADAALAASIFHYGTYTVSELKEFLKQKNILVRPPL